MTKRDEINMKQCPYTKEQIAKFSERRKEINGLPPTAWAIRWDQAARRIRRYYGIEME